jgi:hypothetical protein
LHPDAHGDDFAHADDAALVLLGNFYGTRVLLLSDLGRAGQSALLARTNDLRADMVIAGLPDEGEPLCDALLDAVHSRKSSSWPTRNFPRPGGRPETARTAGAKRKIPVIYTRTSGAVKIVRDRTVGNCARWTGKKIHIEPRPGIEPDHYHRCHHHIGRL